MIIRHPLPTPEADALLDLTVDLAERELAPKVAKHEASAMFPRDVFGVLGRAGLLGLPYDERYGGGGQPYEVYLRVIETLAGTWLTVALGTSVHVLSCFPVHEYGTDEQKDRFLPDMLGGDRLGAYCLSEPASGSDAGALSTRAARDGDEYVVNGVKAWISHAGQADFYTLMARTGEDGPRGVSSFLVDASTPGVLPQPPEHKMGMSSSPTAQLVFDGARVPADRLVGEEGQGFRIAMAALNGGRLGMAACAVGIAQAALDYASAYAREREQFGRSIIDFQGLGFLLADMATQVEAGRALYLAAARARDAGEPYATAAAMAKLYCSDMAMRVTTDAVQVLGGYGYVSDHPVERWMREAKVLQIVEGTNQIQRELIARSLAKR